MVHHMTSPVCHEWSYSSSAGCLCISLQRVSERDFRSPSSPVALCRFPITPPSETCEMQFYHWQLGVFCRGGDWVCGCSIVYQGLYVACWRSFYLGTFLELLRDRDELSHPSWRNDSIVAVKNRNLSLRSRVGLPYVGYTVKGFSGLCRWCLSLSCLPKHLSTLVSCPLQS